ncbi:type VI secretion system protein TssL, long form [Vibrio sp. SCSIO 43136]|uniref:type VI secretion system protein TssL, long form n=1 Tax=Vibrio sp. SCSIO 43136 TaxID=2819101 RepID=UPI0020763F00|nr:type VI secretion system protein TssL, long form [Vibrio sp. SCSIO 43136]USD67506.1 type VI secretion system protein TssL, long form [Vibrio sp. SCSIO 43136]
MSDMTILKPTPGRRSAVLSDSSPESRTQSRTKGTVLSPNLREQMQRSKHLNLAANPLVEEANGLFTMIGQIRCTEDHQDVPSLRQAFINKINGYESALRALRIDSNVIESARYCLCSAADEAVLNTHWGESSIWSSDSLLSIFHSQTVGGEHFFNLLDDSIANPHGQEELLELQYICLSLGFVGKMRIEKNGESQLEDYRQRAYERLKLIQGEVIDVLSDGKHGSGSAIGESLKGIPSWVTVSGFGVLLLSIYMGYSYALNSYSDGVFNQITRLVSPPKQHLVSNANQEVMNAMQQRLSTEIDMGLLSLVDLGDRIRLTINSHELFAAGDAEVKSSFMPIIQKVARVLESTKGRLLITGHTDDQPIFTSRYPSNWHLSLARANAVANLMSVGSTLQGRLWPEGKGDSEPLGPNGSEAERAKNRRVEIDLLVQ